MSPFIRFFAVSALCFSSAFAGLSHAPAGIMGNHVHKKGEAMFSYNGSYQKMKNINGSVDEMLMEYETSPTQMKMKMHMLMVMYGITDNFNIMAMGQFMEMNMDSLGGGMHYDMHHDVSGIGDTEVTALYKFFDKDGYNGQANLGLVIPTGSIDKTHRHMSHTTRMGYSMQTGSGSYSLKPQLNFAKIADGYEIGSQFTGLFRLDKNDNGYKRGNVYSATAWAVKKLNSGFSSSIRASYTKTMNVKGIDAKLHADQSVFSNPYLQSSTQLEVLAGVGYAFDQGLLKNTEILIEGGVPAYQKVPHGTLKNKYLMNLSLRYTL